jgi:hypothetical protein
MDLSLNPFTEPMRPLTEREIKKILGSLLGAMIDMVEDVEVVRQAVIWFGSADPVALNVWAAFKQIKEQMEKLRTMQPPPPVTGSGRKPD